MRISKALRGAGLLLMLGFSPLTASPIASTVFQVVSATGRAAGSSTAQAVGVNASVLKTSVWPFPPNWRDPVHALYEFKTDIFTSRSGKEQRRALRTSPRVTMKFTVTRGAEDRRKLDRILHTAQVNPIYAPDLTRKVRLTTSTAPGATVLHVSDISADWLDVTRYVIVATPMGYQRFLINDRDFGAATITLDAPVNVSLLEGCKVHPSYTGRLAEELQAKLVTTMAVEADIAFTPFPAENPAPAVGSISDIFNQREVCLIPVNWVSPQDLTYAKTIDKVDFARGRVVYYQPVNFGERTRKFEVLMPDEAARSSVVEMFGRMKGQRGEFYLPQWEDDFTIIAPAAGGTSTLVVAGTDIHDTFQSDDLYRAVMIRSGSNRFYRRIVTTTSNGTNTTITTDLTWPLDINETTTVNWLVVHRFALDLLDVESVTDEVSKTSIAFTALEDLPVSGPDQVFPGLDGAAQWVLDNWGLNFFLDEIADPLDVLVNYYYPWISRTIGTHALFDESFNFIVGRYEEITT